MTKLTEAAALIEQVLQESGQTTRRLFSNAASALSEQIAEAERKSRERDEKILAALADISSRLQGTQPAPAPTPVPTDKVEFTGPWLDDYPQQIDLGPWKVVAGPHGAAGQPDWSYQWVTGVRVDERTVAARARWEVAPRADGAGDVVGFPALLIGQKPGHPTTVPIYPMRVGDAEQSAMRAMNATIIEEDVASLGHLCWNFWFQPTADRATNWAAATRSAEVIVQIRRWGGYSNPLGEFAGRDLRKRAGWIDFNGRRCALFIDGSGAGAGVPLYLIIPETDAPMPRLSIPEMLSAIPHIPRDHYLCSTECGIEIVADASIGRGRGSVAWTVG